MTENMTVAAFVAVVVALLMDWFPGLRAWWDRFAEGQKRGIMAAIVALISVVVVIGNCYWWGDTCPADWWAAVWEIVLVFLAAATANQGVHRLLKR